MTYGLKISVHGKTVRKSLDANFVNMYGEDLINWMRETNSANYHLLNSASGLWGY